jgi:hypothetical protein
MGNYIVRSLSMGISNAIKPSRRRLALYLLAVIVSVTCTGAVALVITAIAYIKGGVTMAIQIWVMKPTNPYEQHPYLALAVGIPIGMAAGYRLWGWLVRKLNILSDEEFKNLS